MTAQFVPPPFPSNLGFGDVAAPIYDADLNEVPAMISYDSIAAAGRPGGSDRVRGFLSQHTGGANFVYADGSTHFYSESTDRQNYISRSQIQSGRVQTD